MRTIGTMVAVLLVAGVGARAAGPAEELTPERRQELEKKAEALDTEGLRYYQAGNYAKAIEVLHEALEMNRALYPKAKYPDGHPSLSRCINNLGLLHWAAGEYGKAEALLREALDMKRDQYPKAKYPNGHPELAASINNLAVLHRAAADYSKAEPLFCEAIDMYRALYPETKYPNGHADLASCIDNLGMLYRYAGKYGQAEALFREAINMYRALYPKAMYPNGRPDLAISISNLGQLHDLTGQYGKAEPLFREALDMKRALYTKAKFPNGHPSLALSINNLGSLYHVAGEYRKAEVFLREALEMTRALYPKAKFPNGHPDLALITNNLGLLQWDAGEYGKAEVFLREALEMTGALYPKAQYPDGHPELATSINNFGRLQRDAGDHGKAEANFREALEMHRALYPKAKYPDGHPELATSINNLGLLHWAAGEYGKAEPLFREALAMDRALYPKAKYPDGHPYLAASISSLGSLHWAAGEYGKAEPLFHEALDMTRALYPKAKYPDGHPQLANSILSLGALHWAAGEYGKAETCYHESLEMQRGLLRRYVDLAAEAEALNFVAKQPLTRDALLSVTRDRSNAAATYDDLWGSRALLMRVQERRHRQLAASRDPALRELADQLRLARLSLSRRLLRPLNDPDANRADITGLTDAKEHLEKRLAAKMKLPPLPKEEMPAPRQLAKLLPACTCFVDLYRYTDFEQDPDIKGKKGEKQTLRYVAFVVRPGAAPTRVELGEANVIEQAWADWHNAISATRLDDAAERKAAAALAHCIWGPLRKELPRDLETVYLTADGALHQVPFGALPGAKAGTVLLEDHAICLVPHGPFLLHRLQEKTSTEETATGRLLAIGGIDYQDCASTTDAPPIALREAALPPSGVRWPPLAGTDKERQQVAALAGRTAHLEVTERSGKDANTEQFQRDLPSARYAHVATHGFFADPKFRSALQIDPNEFGAAGVRDRRGGARSPLSLSGLVFAGANRSGKEAAEDRGILTAEGIIGLRLEGLELAVLSACETGLGAYGGGEGTYGLQRACHIAGCRNMVASLWKVDDAATQALMALFYTNLWQKKLDPAEALRQAQLTLYRNPSAVAVAKRRGVDFTESDLPKVENKPEEKRKRTPTAQWAAFTFSGVRPGKPD